MKIITKKCKNQHRAHEHHRINSGGQSSASLWTRATVENRLEQTHSEQRDVPTCSGRTGSFPLTILILEYDNIFLTGFAGADCFPGDLQSGRLIFVSSFSPQEEVWDFFTTALR